MRYSLEFSDSRCLPRPVGLTCKVEDSQGKQLTSLDDWKNLHEPDKWKPGRSAYSVAEFIVNQRGAARLRQRVSSVLGEPVVFRKLVPEYEIRFDRYGKGRIHDLGILGKTDSERSLFVGVEAKVDETFNEYIGDVWRKANKLLERGENTNQAQRIQELCARFKGASRISEDSFDIRYQLLYSAAGTIDAGADVSVFYVVVFRTDAYDASIGESNHQDYLRFIEWAGGKPIGPDGGGASAHLLMLGNKRLVSIYEYFDAR